MRYDIKIKAPSGINEVPNTEPNYVNTLESMFEGCSVLESDLSKWDVSNIINMRNMFKGALLFNSDLSSWSVDHFDEKPEGFDDETPNWTLPKPKWKVKEEPVDPPEEKPVDPEVPEVDPPEGEPEKPTDPEVDPPTEGGEGNGETPPIDPPEEKPTDPEVPTDPPEEKPTDPEKPEEKPEVPEGPGGEEKPEEKIDDYICPCDGNTLIDFPVGDGFDLMNFRAEARISCFEKQPSVMKPRDKDK